MANGGIIGKVNNPTSTTATGVWQQEEQYEARVTDTWPEKPLFTTKSLRFNGPSSDTLTRTFGSSGNKKTFTLSAWYKRSEVGVEHRIFSTHNTGSPAGYASLHFHTSDDLIVFNYNGSSSYQQFRTDRKFRDVSAWYHIVLAYDTTQGTDTNRAKLYVNGVQETSFSTATYPSQNADLYFNDNVIHYISGGDTANGSNPYSGYMSEVIFVDGQQLTPTSFGVANSDGVWTPIPYTGTFGTNGFNLQFENAAALGTDSSPNGNTFTVNNLTSIDQTTDTPTNNFCTMNALDNYYAASTFSEGNLKFISQASGYQYNTATFGLSQGKWYFEVKLIAAYNNDEVNIGIAGRTTESSTGYLGLYNDTYGMYGDNGNIYNGGSSSSYGVAYAVGDIIGVYMDLDNNKLYYAKNGTIMNSGTGKDITAATSTTTGFYFPALGDYFGGQTATFEVNFGNPTFTGTDQADVNG